MYIDTIRVENFRTFARLKQPIQFLYPGLDFEKHKLPVPRLRNINLVLGNNGSGKTTLLKAIALVALGPAAPDSGIFPYRLVRREPGERLATTTPTESAYPLGREALLEASFVIHEQDQVSGHSRLESRVGVTQIGDLERLRWRSDDEKPWHPVFSASSDAFFMVGYGANRRVVKQENERSPNSRVFPRAQRVLSIFDEEYALRPLNTWLPEYESENAGRYTQVVNLVNRLLGEGHYEFKGEVEEGEFLFEKGGLKVPFPALSDGYRAYLGWIGDLLYHVCMTCPKGKKLVENHGIVLVDEIDLHLHPKWQMDVLPKLSKALPNLQFIITSHSPLVVGSLEWMNILFMEPGPRQTSRVRRMENGVHGMDADQVLLTKFFGLQSTRAPGKRRDLKSLSLRAREGDADAAEALLAEMSRGSEAKP